MTGRKRPARVRFYFDADVLGLARVVAGLRSDCTFPGDPGAVVHGRERPACPLPRDAPDLQWLPEVAARGWLAITRDAAIVRRLAELDAVRESGVRLVVLSGREATGTWAQLEVLLSRWREIEALAERPGPVVVTATRRSPLREVQL